ncbi:MAG: AarF/UbiB family protein [Erysipelotrichaceae bacterium]|nr:AarF/UbiB family protein [Erysipelotrichaceae bacterium]
MSQNNENTLSGKRRLAQIVGILRKHHITQGIDPVKFREILEDLGPTFVKIGQIMASRQDMFSARYCNELVKLRDNVAPMDNKTVRQMIEGEYGCKLEDVFEYFDWTPLGSASIAQVHQAVLKNGQIIVVKVQRPHIYEMMERDIALVRQASSLLKLSEILGNVVDIDIVLDEFWETAKEEMDFLNEAQYAHRFKQLNSELKYIGVPHIETAYTTSKVLVMEYIDGYEINDLEGLKEAGYDIKEIATKLAENYIKQIVDDGFFHADPHPGNLRIRDGQIVWIDFGMMGNLSRGDKTLMKDAVLAIGRNDTQKVADVILTLGNHDGHIDYTKFYDDIDSFMNRYVSADLISINLGDLTQELFAIAHKHKIAIPKGVSMLARGLVTIESTVMAIDPHMSVIEIATNHVANHVSQNDPQKELTNFLRLTYSATQSSMEIPSQVSQLMRMLMKGRLKINLELMESSVPMTMINHMVNKLIVGIVAAGLLIASSMLCMTNMTPQVLGIPAIGFIGYLTAVGLGIWLLFTVIKERRQRK